MNTKLPRKDKIAFYANAADNSDIGNFFNAFRGIGDGITILILNAVSK